MWRVVLRGFLQVRFFITADPEWCSVLKAFAESPSKKQFEWRPEGTVLSTGSASAKDIVMEILRLYPPTRRVFRAYRWQENTRYSTAENRSTEDPKSYKIIAADIEACHLNNDIWGLDAKAFRPLRWHHLSQEQNEAFMPFGARPFECPAKAQFGPQMIGLLIGILVSALEDNDSGAKINWRVTDKDIVQCLSNARLDMARDAYGTLELIGSWEVN
ncbi:hypothetical protein PENDEC_c017G02879 [Penicillium decumbens]|uniref:Cytochrome P450 n=1 Tax=Penicillium decumbens TaxID=69771 RepID=A0A1V6P7X2_PENDC|nr:hypothetical protein PENDEC_c017G02879 [Penicillium decumbens]